MNYTGTLIIYMAAVWFCISGCGEKHPAGQTGAEEVVVWAHEGQPAEKQALEQIFKNFNAAHKEISVKVEFKQEQGYGDRVNAAAVAGQLPDIIDVDGPYTAHFAEVGILAPLDDLLADSVKNDFLPTIIAQGTYNRKTYTLGAFESTAVIYYRRDIMDRCGITPPGSIDNAWTWEEFLQALRSIKKRERGTLPVETFITWGGEWLTYAFTPLVWSNGGALISADGRRTAGQVNGPTSVQALEEWQKLFTEGLTDRNAPPGQFRDGKAAMCWGIFNRWPMYTKGGVEFGMMPLPKLKRAFSPSGSWCWGITSACKNRKAAYRVIAWLTGPEGIAAICRANGGIPARESAVKLMPEYARTRGLFIEQLRRTARARPSTSEYGTLTKALSRALEDISRGASVKASLDRVAGKMDGVLGSN